MAELAVIRVVTPGPPGPAGPVGPQGPPGPASAVIATGASQPLAAADVSAKRLTLDDFGASAGVPAHTAFNNAMASGVKELAIHKTYTWTGQAVVNVDGVRLLFAAAQNKGFNGDLFVNAVLRVRWIGLILNCQGFSGLGIRAETFDRCTLEHCQCTDFPENSHFLEIMAANKAARSVFIGGYFQSVAGSASVGAPDGDNACAVKLYGDDTHSDQNSANAAFLGFGGRIDLGGSYEAKIVGSQTVWPQFYTTSGQTKVMACRMTVNKADNTAIIKGQQHEINGISTGANLIVQASETQFSGNSIGGFVQLDATGINCSPNNNRLQGGIQITPNFSGYAGGPLYGPNAAVTFVPAFMPDRLIANQTLTAARAWRISKTSAVVGQRLTIYHNALGGFAITVRNDANTTIATLNNGQKVVIELGADWTVVP